MTNFKKKKTRKRHNKNNRKKRTRKLRGGNQKIKIINNIKEVIKKQQLRHKNDFKKGEIYNHPDGGITEPKWLNIIKDGRQILPGIGGVYDKERFKTYLELERNMTTKQLKKEEKKIIKEIKYYDEWTEKCKPFDKEENKMTCQQLAVQRGYDCRGDVSNPQEGNQQPSSYGVELHIQPSTKEDEFPEWTPTERKFIPSDQATIVQQKTKPTTSTPTSIPTSTPTSIPTTDDEEGRATIQYMQREEGATVLHPGQTTDQVSSNTKATFDFVGVNRDELSFDAGDEITVTEYKVDNSFDWAKGYKTNDTTKTVGIFPKNYTTLIATDKRVSTKACGNLNIPQGATYYIDEEKNWFAEKNDDRISGDVVPRLDREKSINYYYNHVTDKVTYDNTDGTCDTEKVEIEGQPFWYKETEKGKIIYRKYKGGKLIREQTLFPQVWHSSGTKNLVINDDPTEQAPEDPVPVTPASEESAPVTPVSEESAPVTQASEESAPVTPVSEESAPVTPAIEEPAPVTPAIEEPSPVTPAPVTPAPVTPAPVTPASVTPASVTPASVTPASEVRQPRNNLLAEIHQGTTLKPFESADTTTIPVRQPRNNLLSQIKAGKKLKHVDPTTHSPEKCPEGQIRDSRTKKCRQKNEADKISDRRTAIAGDDENQNSDDDDGWDPDMEGGRKRRKKRRKTRRKTKRKKKRKKKRSRKKR